MSRTAHLFDCLWRSEPDPDRFENLREWVFVVHTDAKTKLKARELFVKLQQRKRQRSHILQQSHSKPCNPALHTPTTQEIMTYDASIAGTTGRSTGQAMPDLRGTDVTDASHKLDTTCGMSPKPRRTNRAKTYHANNRTRQMAIDHPKSESRQTHETSYRNRIPRQTHGEPYRDQIATGE